MTKKTILLLTAALAAAVPACASHSYRPPRGVKVPSLAHRLEEAARHVHRSAEGAAHHGTRTEAAALARLHELEEAARHFHRQAERYRQDPYHTESDFRHLVDAFREARAALPWLHAYGHIEEDFRAVEALMYRLAAFYGYPPGYLGRYGSRHGPYGDRPYGDPYEYGGRYGVPSPWDRPR